MRAGGVRRRSRDGAVPGGRFFMGVSGKIRPGSTPEWPDYLTPNFSDEPNIGVRDH